MNDTLDVEESSPIRLFAEDCELSQKTYRNGRRRGPSELAPVIHGP